MMDMKNIYKTIIAALAAMPLLFSCELFKEMVVEPDSVQLSEGSDSVLVFSGAEAEKTVVIVANVDWTASSNQDWCEVSPSEGTSGETRMALKVSASKSSKERTAVVTVTAGTANLTIVVNQSEKLTLSASKADYEFDAEGGTFEVMVKHNMEYEVEIPRSQDWVKEVKSKAVSRTVHVFEVEENDEGEDREATIVFRSADGEFQDEVTVYQHKREEAEPEPEPEPGPEPELLSIIIFHENMFFTVPSFNSGATGTIDWGDGSQEEFSADASHEYVQPGKHMVFFDLAIAKEELEFTITDLTGILRLNLEKLPQVNAL